MKKLLGLGAVFAGVLLLTGCGGDGKTYTCSATYTEGEESMTQELVAHLDDDNKIESYDLVYVMSSEESAATIYEMYEGESEIKVTKSGKKVTIKDAQKLDGADSSIIGKTKEELKEFIQKTEPDISCK